MTALLRTAVDAARETAWPDAIPRCKRDHFGSFCGTHRPARLADELGAVEVVELVFGGRVCFRPESSAPGVFRIWTLP